MGVLVLFQEPKLVRGFVNSSAAGDVLDRDFTAAADTVTAEIWPLHPSTAVTQVEYNIDSGAWQTAGWDAPTSVATMHTGDLQTGGERRMHTLTIRVHVDVDEETAFVTAQDMTVLFFWRGTFTAPTGTGTGTGTGTDTGTGTGTSTGTGSGMLMGASPTPAPKKGYRKK